MHIGVLYIDVFINSSQSLKQKRTVLTGLKTQVRSKFNVSIGELGNNDKWQLATLGFSMIGKDNRYIDGVLQNLLSFVDKHHSVEVSNHKIEFC